MDDISTNNNFTKKIIKSSCGAYVLDHMPSGSSCIAHVLDHMSSSSPCYTTMCSGFF